MRTRQLLHHNEGHRFDRFIIGLVRRVADAQHIDPEPPMKEKLDVLLNPGVHIVNDVAQHAGITFNVTFAVHAQRSAAADASAEGFGDSVLIQIVAAVCDRRLRRS